MRIKKEKQKQTRCKKRQCGRHFWGQECPWCHTITKPNSKVVTAIMIVVSLASLAGLVYAYLARGMW